MAELVYAQVSEACVRKDLRVRVPLRPPTAPLHDRLSFRLQTIAFTFVYRPVAFATSWQLGPEYSVINVRYGIALNFSALFHIPRSLFCSLIAF